MRAHKRPREALTSCLFDSDEALAAACSPHSFERANEIDQIRIALLTPQCVCGLVKDYRVMGVVIKDTACYSCTCPDSTKRDRGLCKHIAAMFKGRRDVVRSKKRPKWMRDAQPESIALELINDDYLSELSRVGRALNDAVDLTVLIESCVSNADSPIRRLLFLLNADKVTRDARGASTLAVDLKLEIASRSLGDVVSALFKLASEDDGVRAKLAAAD